MSSGIVHKKASIILAAGFFMGGIFSLDIGFLQYIIGALIGIIFTPDIDVDNGFIGDSIIRNKIGKWAEIIWNGIWYWYRRSLKHGSPLSHMPVIGTIGRISYLYLLFIVVPHFLFYYIFKPDWDLTYVLSLWAENILYPYKVWIGLMASDLIHWTLDICTTEHKNA